jgi:hypothetical protein
MKKYDEENIVNNNEYNSVIINAILSHEQVWIRHSPQSSQDIGVASYITSDHEKSFQVLDKSKEPWGSKVS